MAHRRLGVVLALLLATACSSPETPGAEVLEHAGRWESGYGSKFYNVVGKLRNTSGHAVRWVKLRIELLGADGSVVAAMDTYNEGAEALGVPDLDPQAILATGKVKPLAAGAEQRFRGGFLAEETPSFDRYRVVVVETPPAP